MYEKSTSEWNGWMDIYIYNIVLLLSKTGAHATAPHQNEK